MPSQAIHSVTSIPICQVRPFIKYLRSDVVLLFVLVLYSYHYYVELDKLSLFVCSFSYPRGIFSVYAFLCIINSFVFVPICQPNNQPNQAIHPIASVPVCQPNNQPNLTIHPLASKPICQTSNQPNIVFVL